MSRRGPKIPRRRRIFLGCEGEGEQAYGTLTSRYADEERKLHLAITAELLRPGGGDPLALIELACSRIDANERKRGRFEVKAILLDGDKRGQSLERDQRSILIARDRDIRLIWQIPTHEALLLRHLPNCQNLRPPTAQLAMQTLKQHWPEYQKPMSAAVLSTRIGVADILRAAAVDPELHAFLGAIGFLDRQTA